jgi:hypothetical protein
MLSKAVFMTGPAAGAMLLDDFGAAGLLVTDDGSTLRTTNLWAFLGGIPAVDGLPGLEEMTS